MTTKILGGKWKGKKILTPPDSITRPTQSVVRAAVFNICQGSIENGDFLDCFAGSGAMGLEALSRGAKSAAFIEKDRTALKILYQNIKMLEASSMTTVYPYPLEKALGKIGKHPRPIPERLFDVIYLDPPYGMETDRFIPLLKELLREEGTLFLEERINDDGSQQFPGLQLISTRRFGSTALHEYSIST